MMDSARLLLSAGLVSVLAFAAPALAAQPEDAWVTTKVKMALLTDDTVGGVAIDVDTVEGRVTLHGKVDSAVEKAEAEVIARRVQGVADVRNLLAVTPTGERAAEAAEISDESLEEQVGVALKRDAALEGSDIQVKSVNGGVVVLAGEAKTLSAHQRAIRDARAVPGVRQVASEIRSPDSLGDAEIWEDGKQTGQGEGLQAAAGDAWITTKVKVQLMAEPGLSPLAVNVDTRDGVVTLFGSVSTERLKERAAAQAKTVAGVKAVDNELQVVPEVAAERVEAQDDKLREAVQQRLTSREALSDADIDVAVENGVARLTGTVASQSDRLTALTVARGTEGVDSVVDGLQLAQRKDGR
jgi:hyperosmotically inducible protein